ncbi:hypothetical protein EDC05_006541, partial [Coemansia umbellata]
DTGATNLGSSYIQLANETEYADDSDSTPFGHSHEQKENKLADTPEFSSSWFDKLTFSWSNNLMRKGSLRQLQHSDLYKLNKSDMPVSVWRRYRRHRKPGRSLAVAVALALAPELLLQFACTTVMRCVNFTGPFFLQRIIRSIELSRNNSSEISSRRLYLDAFGLLFFNLVAALMLVQVRWMGHHNIIRVKGLLVAELSSKTLRRRGKDSRKKQNIGSKNKKKHTQSAASAADDGKVMNLLTADFQAIATSFDVMRNISSMGVALGIGIWYMYQMLGVSAFIGLSLFCIYVPLLKIMFTRLTSQTVKTKALSDERISMIAELIQGIKTVKLFGWGSRFLHKIDKQREHQLEYTWKICLCKIAIGTCAALSPMLIFFVIIASYVAVFGNKLTAEVAFTSISIFLILKTIIENLPTNVNAVIAGYVSLGRIESYLDQPQVQDLEKRVALELGDTLGFECADLEWERAEDTDDSSKPDVKVSASTGSATTNTETSDSESSDGTDQSNEGTLLLAESAQLHAIRSTNASTTSLSRQSDLMAFSLKDIDVQFPIGGLSIVA